MVGGHGINKRNRHGMAQRGAVGSGLHGGIHTDAVAQTGIVLIAEPQVPHTGFGRDALLGQRLVRIKKREFILGGEVQHVQSSPGVTRQLHGTARAGHTSLAAADERMRLGRLASPFTACQRARAATIMPSSSQCAAIKAGMVANKRCKDASSSSSMPPVEEPINTFTPATWR